MEIYEGVPNFGQDVRGEIGGWGRVPIWIDRYRFQNMQQTSASRERTILMGRNSRTCVIF